MDKNITFYTIEYEDQDLPVSLEELMNSFDKIHESYGRPVGEEFDQQIELMMLELSNSKNLKHISPDGENFVFYPADMSDEDVQEAIKSLDDAVDLES